MKSFSCLDQFLCMAFAQLTYRESLRDIEACLRAQQTKLYHIGIRSAVSRNTLGQCQRCPRLAHLCRLRPDPDRHRPTACMHKSISASSWKKPSMRSMPRPSICACRYFPGRYSAAAKAAIKLHTLAGSARQHPHLYSHYRWQGARGQCPRLAASRARRLLYHGSWVLRLRAPLSLPRSRHFFITRGKCEPQVPAPLLAAGRSHERR